MQRAIVKAALTDLRREPASKSSNHGLDEGQESQLLMGELVFVLETIGEWACVKAFDQPKSVADEWSGYPGWIQTKDLVEVDSFPHYHTISVKTWVDLHVNPAHGSPIACSISYGTFLKTIESANGWTSVQLPGNRKAYVPSDALRNITIPVSNIVQTQLQDASLFLGMPYLWGGLSAFRSQHQQNKTSLDCSGLIHLLYRACGMTVPRDAHDQYVMSKRKTLADLEAGDLLFTPSPDRPGRMGHVMLYAGDQMIIESSLQAGKVRKVSLEEKFGCPLVDVPGLQLGVFL